MPANDRWVLTVAVAGYAGPFVRQKPRLMACT